jgi:hypothetical protein
MNILINIHVEVADSAITHFLEEPKQYNGQELSVKRYHFNCEGRTIIGTEAPRGTQTK